MASFNTVTTLVLTGIFCKHCAKLCLPEGTQMFTIGNVSLAPIRCQAFFHISSHVILSTTCLKWVLLSLWLFFLKETGTERLGELLMCMEVGAGLDSRSLSLVFVLSSYPAHF